MRPDTTRMVILGVYALVIAVLMLDAGDPDILSWWVGMVPFFLFAISPIAFLCLTSGLELGKRIGALLVAVGGLWMYVDAMYVSGPDAQAGLVFLFAPVVQWLAVVLVLLVSWLSHKFREREEA